jgi:nitrite reductase/ring-hydroxylating ferredoxin subunit
VTADSFVPVAAVADVKPGTARTVVVDGREIGLFNVEGTFYALDNTCPHQGGPLSEGYIEGTTVTCPWHAWCFNLTDGKMPFATWAKTDPYDVRVEGGRVFVSRTPRVSDGGG